MRERPSQEIRSFDDNFSRALAPILVLSLLKQKEMYIYKIAKELSEKSSGKYEALALYPVISRLKAEGYVNESKQIIEDNRVRNYYRITDQGFNYLHSLIKQLNLSLDTVKIIAGDILNEHCE